jgi:hypothetical protein
MSEFMEALVEEVDLVKAEKLAIMNMIPAKQLAGVEKAIAYGWVVMSMRKDTVVLAANGKQMRIDSDGKRINEVRV